MPSSKASFETLLLEIYLIIVSYLTFFDVVMIRQAYPHLSEVLCDNGRADTLDDLLGGLVEFDGKELDTKL